MLKAGIYSRRSLSSKEWRKELLVSWLFQTCFRLQASLDRRFLSFGMTFQEATVLKRCVEAGEIAPSRLALLLARDKGKITRFIDRLEASELVKRQVNTRDRRYSVIKPTPKGTRLAERIASTFDQIRKDLFVRLLDHDIQRLSRALPQLLRNAVQISAKRSTSGRRRARRIGKKNSYLQKVENVRMKETSSTKELSSATGRQNGLGPEQRGERLARVECKNLASGRKKSLLQ